MYRLALSPDSAELAGGCAERVVARWDVSGPEPRALPPLDTGTTAYHPTEPILAVGANGWVQMWNTRLGVRVLHQPWHSGNIYDVAFSPDGKLFASTNRDGTVAVRRVPDFTLVKELRLVTDSRRVVFADARMPATLPHDGESPLRDTAQDFRRAASWNVGVGNSRALGVSPDGRQVVCAVRNADPRAWYVRGQAEARLSAGGATTAFGFRPDGARFAAARDDHVMRPVRPPGGGAGSRVQPGRPPRGHRLRRPPGSGVGRGDGSTAPPAPRSPRRRGGTGLPSGDDRVSHGRRRRGGAVLGRVRGEGPDGPRHAAGDG